jgi:hypothetical protein
VCHLYVAPALSEWCEERCLRCKLQKAAAAVYPTIVLAINQYKVTLAFAKRHVLNSFNSFETFMADIAHLCLPRILTH